MVLTVTLDLTAILISIFEGQNNIYLSRLKIILN